MIKVKYFSKHFDYSSTIDCDSKHIPRVGDKVNIFYVPVPTVISVIWEPDLKTVHIELD